MKFYVAKFFTLIALVTFLPAAGFSAVTLKPATKAVPKTGGTGVVTATFAGEAGGTVALSPLSSDGWLTVTSTTPVSGTVPLNNGAGTGKVTFRAAANATGVPRSATLTVAGSVFSVTQPGQTCTPVISATKAIFAAAGGEGRFTVTIPSGCPWTATMPNGSTGVVITQGSSGTGSGEVTYTVLENSDPTPKATSLTVSASNPVTSVPTGTKVYQIKQAKYTAATPLTVAKRVSVVDAKNNVSLNIAQGAAMGDAATAYDTDVTRRYVEERSAEVFSSVNEILCMIAQSRYDAMLNKGPYTALIDAKLCQTAQSSVTSDTQTASQAPSYTTWTVDASRSSDTAPQMVKAWVHQDAEGEKPAIQINAKLTITEAATDDNPFGIFTVDFAGYPVLNGSLAATKVSQGTLKSVRDNSGQVILQFVENELGPDGGSRAASFHKAVDGTGSGSVNSASTMGQEAFDFAFSTTNFRRVTTGNDVCFDRNAYSETAWRYGLYDDNGARVNLTSGFPIRLDKNGKRSYGWVGYWGTWFPANVSLATGDTVYRQSFTDTPDTTPYQVLAAGGKMVKHTRATTTLDEIRNTPLQLWLQSGPQGSGSYRVSWNGTTFVIDAVMGQQGGWSFLDNPTTLDVSTLNQPMVSFWSETLSGSGQLNLNCSGGTPGTGFTCGAPDGSATVIYYREEPILPGDTVPASLACFDNCPDASAITTDTPFKTTNSFQTVVPTDAQYVSYPFDTTAMVLKDGTAPVVAATTSQQGGVRSGPLFEATNDNLSLLACPWDSTKTCAWQAWSELPLYYTWETGANSWNRLTVLLDPQEAPLRFDPPIRVSYTHVQNDAQAPDAKYNGVKMSLEYQGFGELQGIPGGCYDEAGNPVQCGNNTRFIADFVIPAGTTVTNERTSATYKVKPLEIGQFMQRSQSGCSGLTITPYTLPTLSTWHDPALGNEPVIPGAPAVVGGVLR